MTKETRTAQLKPRLEKPSAILFNLNGDGSVNIGGDVLDGDKNTTTDAK